MDIQAVKDFMDGVVNDPALKSTGETTYCNCASRKIAQFFGCHEFDNENLLADDMKAIMVANASGKWTSAIGSVATVHALNGGLALAAMSSQQLNAQHGHITAIYPVIMQFSGSLQKFVPVVAGVGGVVNSVEKVSEQFPVALGEPDYFIWS